jgi:hypothetical protein
MGVDYTNVASGAGRASVRLTSKKSYNNGLVILDLAHMPGGICGTWPALYVVPYPFELGLMNEIAGWWGLIGQMTGRSTLLKE